ncbi:MAG: molecular chaperone TorD family protein [Pseudomonadota bacterium]
MPSASPASSSVADEDLLRAQLYRLLGSLLAREPTADVLGVIRNLQGDDSELGRAFQKLAGQADKFGEEAVRREFLDLFIGVGRGELVPYGSYYLTGFLNEKPLAKLRNAMRDLGIERADNVKEPEDNIGSLMEMMAGLIEGDFGAPLSHQEQKAFFDNHVGNWASYFFRDLSAAESAKFYKPVGEIGVLFMEIEKAAIEMAGEQQSAAGD